MGGADASGAIVRVRGVEPGDAEAVATLLDALGYPCTQEQENPAYKFFLGSN